MAGAASNPFTDVQRDRWGRPLIIQPDGSTVAYRRASSLSNVLADSGGLETWKTRLTLAGVGRSAELTERVQRASADGWQDDRVAKAELSEISRDAFREAGGYDASDYGTKFHALTVPGGTDDLSGDIEPALLRDAEAFWDGMSRLGLEIVATEQFVVNDDLKVAGTYDHAIRCNQPLRDPNSGEVVVDSGDVLLADKKTGSLHMTDHAVQLAVYATGVRYNFLTGARAPSPVSAEWGILIHVFRRSGVARFYLVDLVAGYSLAQFAIEIHARRADKPYHFEVTAS